MRTNVVLNEDLLREAKKYSLATTKKGLLEEALQVFVQTKTLEKKARSYRERLDLLDSKLAGIKLRERPLNVLRESRERG